MTAETLLGIRITQSQYAVTTQCEVQRHPIRKRRRNWRVVRVTRPGSFLLNGGAVMVCHPEIYRKLMEHTHA